MLRNRNGCAIDVVSQGISAVTWKSPRELTSTILPPLLSISIIPELGIGSCES